MVQGRISSTIVVVVVVVVVVAIIVVAPLVDTISIAIVTLVRDGGVQLA